MTAMSEPFKGAPRPRVLVFGLTEVEIETIRPLAGSLVVAENPYDFHSEEHDVLIVTDANFSDHSHFIKRRLVFASKPEVAKPTGRVSSSFGGSSSAQSTAARTQFRPARDFEITEFSREHQLETLVRRSCFPQAGFTYSGFTTPVYPERKTSVLAQELLAHPLALAALLETDSSLPADDSSPWQPNDSALWLPDMARTALKDWLLFMLARWRQADPEMFPETAQWKRSDKWAAPEEIEARMKLADFVAEEAKRRERASEMRERLTSALETAESEGESWRSLLSDSGAELVAAVKETLELFEFTVVDSDALPQHKGKKREDLRVSDGPWVALVEVKGYSRAAKSNDLQQLTSASVAFAATEGSVPDALWYLVNVHRDIDPAQREAALPDRNDDLAAFAAGHDGCLIDTRELFRLRQCVAIGQITPAEARKELRGAAARYGETPYS